EKLTSRSTLFSPKFLARPSTRKSLLSSSCRVTRYREKLCQRLAKSLCRKSLIVREATISLAGDNPAPQEWYAVSQWEQDPSSYDSEGTTTPPMKVHLPQWPD